MLYGRLKEKAFVRFITASSHETGWPSWHGYWGKFSLGFMWVISAWFLRWEVLVPNSSKLDKTRSFNFHTDHSLRNLIGKTNTSGTEPAHSLTWAHHRKLYKEFRREARSREQGQHGQPGLCEGALHTPASWPQKLTLLVKKLVKLTCSKSSLIERDLRNWTFFTFYGISIWICVFILWQLMAPNIISDILIDLFSQLNVVPNSNRLGIKRFVSGISISFFKNVNATL